MVDVDEIYGALGNPGRYQICVYILLGLNYFPIVTNHLAMAFYGAKLPHHCKVPENTTIDAYIPRYTDEQSNNTVYDSCLVYKNGSNLTELCSNGWVYNTHYGERNIVNEYDLVCDRAHLVSLATTIYFAGVMIGGLIFGALSDRFGRKPFLLTTLYLQIIVGVSMTFANSYLVFAFIRFLQGILMQGLQTSMFVLIMELFTPKHRTTVGAGVEIFWGTGVIWLALIAWLIRDWRYIQLAISLPSIVTLSYIWLVPESVRWLFAQKKRKQAICIVQKAAKFNKVSIPSEILNTKYEDVALICPKEVKVVVQNGDAQNEIVDSDHEKQSVPKEKTYTLLDMFKTRNLLTRSLVLFYLWFAIAVGYFGLSLSLSSLAGNKYFNVFIGGLVELIAYIIALFVLNKYGRRIPLVVYLSIGGVLCIVCGPLPNITSKGYDISGVKTALAVMGRFGLAGGFSVIFLYTSELFPTVIRNVSIGACAFWMRLGGVAAPQILLLGQYTHRSVPIVMFGLIALIGAGLTLFLPETLKQKLPDSIDEAENIRPVKPN